MSDINADKVEAPWTPAQVRAITAWQQAGYVHPLTCETSEHGALIVGSQRLVCPFCAYEQTWVPRLVAETFPSDHRPALVDPGPPPPEVLDLIAGVAAKIEAQTAQRVAALVVAIRLMEMHLELATPGGAGRDSIAWTVATGRVETLRGLLDELQAGQPPQPPDP